MTEEVKSDGAKEPATLGHYIRKLRTGRLMSQRELADKAGISENVIGQIEGNKIKKSRVITLKKICSALELNNDIFMHMLYLAGYKGASPIFISLNEKTTELFHNILKANLEKEKFNELKKDERYSIYSNIVKGYIESIEIRASELPDKQRTEFWADVCLFANNKLNEYEKLNSKDEKKDMSDNQDKEDQKSSTKPTNHSPPQNFS